MTKPPGFASSERRINRRLHWVAGASWKRRSRCRQELHVLTLDFSLDPSRMLKYGWLNKRGHTFLQLRQIRQHFWTSTKDPPFCCCCLYGSYSSDNQSSPPSPTRPVSVANCRVGCQRAALHFDDDSLWRGAFDRLPSFVNKEYALIDAAHIMAVWDLAGERKTRLSCWKGRRCRGPSWRKALLSRFQHPASYDAHYGHPVSSIYPASCATRLISASVWSTPTAI